MPQFTVRLEGTGYVVRVQMNRGHGAEMAGPLQTGYQPAQLTARLFVEAPTAADAAQTATAMLTRELQRAVEQRRIRHLGTVAVTSVAERAEAEPGRRLTWTSAGDITWET